MSKLFSYLRSREKYWLPSNVWNLLRALLPHAILIHYSSYSRLSSESDYSGKSPPKNRFEDMEMTAARSCGMWNFLEWIRKHVGDQKKN